MSLFKKLILFSLAAALILFSTACSKDEIDTQKEITSSSDTVSSTAPPVSISGKKVSNSTGIRTYSPPTVEELEMGRKLLIEYDVQYNQTIRFPFEGKVFATRGANPITSIEDARSKYPDLPIPEKLGEYLFADLTLYADRTYQVFSDMVPPPKDKIEVLTDDRVPQQHYLCYKNDLLHFRIDMWDTSLEVVQEALTHVTGDSTPWPLREDVLIPNENDDVNYLPYLLILPEEEGEYAFWVHKISSEDCLEDSPSEVLPTSESRDFTEEEALSVCNAIREGFSEK